MMQQPTAIEPARLTIADLEVLSSRQSLPAPVPPAPPRPQLTKNEAEHQLLGMGKLIARMNGMDMTKNIHPLEHMVLRVQQLEAENARLRAEFEAEKSHYQKALSVIGIGLEAHVNPFDDKPPSKYTKAELGQLIIEFFQTRDWVMQRAENALDPKNAVAIAPDPEV